MSFYVIPTGLEYKLIMSCYVIPTGLEYKLIICRFMLRSVDHIFTYFLIFILITIINTNKATRRVTDITTTIIMNNVEEFPVDPAPVGSHSKTIRFIYNICQIFVIKTKLL